MSGETVKLSASDSAEPVATTATPKAKPGPKPKAAKVTKENAEPSISEKLAAEPKSQFGYLKNKQGRVFRGTAELYKQYKKGKFGLMRITQAEYITAMGNGGLTEPEPEIEDDED